MAKWNKPLSLVTLPKDAMYYARHTDPRSSQGVSPAQFPPSPSPPSPPSPPLPPPTMSRENPPQALVENQRLQSAVIRETWRRQVAEDRNAALEAAVALSALGVNAEHASLSSPSSPMSPESAQGWDSADETARDASLSESEVSVDAEEVCISRKRALAAEVVAEEGAEAKRSRQEEFAMAVQKVAKEQLEQAARQQAAVQQAAVQQAVVQRVAVQQAAVQQAARQQVAMKQVAVQQAALHQAEVRLAAVQQAAAQARASYLASISPPTITPPSPPPVAAKVAPKPAAMPTWASQVAIPEGSWFVASAPRWLLPGATKQRPKRGEAAGVKASPGQLQKTNWKKPRRKCSWATPASLS